MIKKILLPLLLFIAIIVHPSCNDDMSGPSFIDKLKLLAIKLDKPQVHPGDEVKASILLAKPQDYSEEFHSVILLCDPGAESGSGNSFFNCMNPNKENIISTPIIDKEEIDIEVPSDTLSKYDLKEKYLYLIYILCESDINTCMVNASSRKNENDSTLKVSLKRIHVVNNDMEITNNNPIIKNVYLNNQIINGDTLVFDTKELDFIVEIDKSSFDKKSDGKYEDMVVTWYSSRGEFDLFYTNEEFKDDFNSLDINEFNTKDSTGDYQLYIVASDKRGGFDWRVINIKEE